MRLWYAIADKATGRLVSLSTVIAGRLHPDTGKVVDGELASHLEVIEIGPDRPDLGVLEWSPATRSFLPLIQPDTGP